LGETVLGLWLIRFVEEHGQLLWKMEFSMEWRSENRGDSVLAHLCKGKENLALQKFIELVVDAHL
jgi:hypothetical protein